MQKLQLFITGTRVDLFKDESVSITQTIQNVKDIAKIFTEFTQTFTIPASKTNNKLFKHYYNYDISNTFDARNKVAAEIQLNNIPFKKGFIRLEGVQLKKNKPYSYKITFFGETVNLKDLLGDDQLSALDLSTNDIDYDNFNIRAKMITSSGPLITPLISHTRQLYYDSSSSKVATGNLYYTNSSNDNGVFFSDLKYALRLHEIIEAIETKYSITFSNDFFDSSNATWYNLYLWLHRKSGDVEPAQQVSMQFRTVSGFSLFSSPPAITTNLGNGVNISSTYTSYPNSILGFTFSLIPATANTDYTFRIFRNGSLIFQREDVQNTQLVTETDFTITSGTYTISIGSTTTVVFNAGNIRFAINGTLGGIDDGSVTSWSDEWRSTSQTQTSTTFEFVISEQIPKMKIIDFLSAIFKMFNLTAFVNEAGTIVVQKLDDFFAASSVTHTIDEYVDVKTSNVDVALPFKEIVFSYKGLGTFLAKQFEQLENKGWGTIEYQDNASFDAPSDIYKVEVPFEHFQYQRLVNATGGASTTIQWGWSVNDNQESFYGLPLIFYAIKVTGGTPISLKAAQASNTSNNSYWIPSNSRAISSSTSTDNIHFNLETNEYTGGTTFTGTLFENCYKSYIQDVFNNGRRLTKVKAKLPLKIIYNLKLNDKISLHNRNYRINSIKTNLTTGDSNLELLNIV
ncbi:MAG: hypothetical protein Unbinned306contig1002_35 [Prokaryotic dsDNA virus sp.]|nr:MAG: hypothetical protein Unbinned306contig1002_35 [Prokaryotic dsDNA virus sp.]|tara:strand:- start:9422 stop:11470 length:2049 start_codon:yes stop_codon:yes gene_type:complete